MVRDIAYLTIKFPDETNMVDIFPLEFLFSQVGLSKKLKLWIFIKDIFVSMIYVVGGHLIFKISILEVSNVEISLLMRY